jgi:hypothetical protein
VVKGFHLHASLKGSSENGAKSIGQSLEGLLKLGLKEWDGNPPKDGSNQILALITKKMLEGAKVEVKGKEATLHMHADVPLEKMISKILESE